jgi:hypothetical protein
MSAFAESSYIHIYAAAYCGCLCNCCFQSEACSIKRVRCLSRSIRPVAGRRLLASEHKKTWLCGRFRTALGARLLQKAQHIYKLRPCTAEGVDADVISEEARAWPMPLMLVRV